MRISALPVERLELECGLRVLIQPDRRVPLITSHLCIVAGSAQEPPDRSGLAHLCEHLAFDGASREPTESLPRQIRSSGGLAEAWTHHDRTTFSSILPAEFLSLALHSEAVRLSGNGLAVSSDRLRLQRKILGQERLQTVDNRPYGRSFERLQQLLYPEEHPYHRPPAGLADGLRAVRRRDVENYFHRHYVPPRAILTLIGDVSPRAAGGAIERAFSDPAQNGHDRGRPLLSSRPSLPKAMGEDRRGALRDRVPLGRLYLGSRGPGFGSEEWYALTLFLRALALGSLSPLRRALVSRQRLAHHIEAQLVSMRDASTVAIVVTALPDVGLDQLETALVATLDDVLARGLDRATLEAARKKALNHLYWLLQRPMRRADYLSAMAAFFDAPERVSEMDERYRSLGAAEVIGSARRFCRPGNRALLSVEPQGGRP